MIDGLDKEPRGMARGTSILLGSYMLTFRCHKAHLDRIQILLTDGCNLVSESWIDRDELRAVIDPVIRREAS